MSETEVVEGFCVSCSVIENLLNKGNPKKGFSVSYENDEVVLRYNYRWVGVGFGFHDWEWDTIYGDTIEEVLAKVK
jgi:hypothetical protein